MLAGGTLAAGVLPLVQAIEAPRFGAPGASISVRGLVPVAGFPAAVVVPPAVVPVAAVAVVVTVVVVTAVTVPVPVVIPAGMR